MELSDALGILSLQRALTAACDDAERARVAVDLQVALEAATHNPTNADSGPDFLSEGDPVRCRAEHVVRVLAWEKAVSDALRSVTDALDMYSKGATDFISLVSCVAHVESQGLLANNPTKLDADCTPLTASDAHGEVKACAEKLTNALNEAHSKIASVQEARRVADMRRDFQEKLHRFRVKPDSLNAEAALAGAVVNARDGGNDTDLQDLIIDAERALEAHHAAKRRSDAIATVTRAMADARELLDRESRSAVSTGLHSPLRTHINGNAGTSPARGYSIVSEGSIAAVRGRLDDSIAEAVGRGVSEADATVAAARTVGGRLHNLLVRRTLQEAVGRVRTAQDLALLEGAIKSAKDDNLPSNDLALVEAEALGKQLRHSAALDDSIAALQRAINRFASAELDLFRFMSEIARVESQDLRDVRITGQFFVRIVFLCRWDVLH